MPAVRAAAAAVAFLTRIPIPAPFTAADVARGAVFFPLVGAGLGAAVGAAADALAAPLSAPLASVIAVALGTALTGALHLDGLADTADALGAATREHALEIMRDHRVGAYGAIALVLGIAAKIAAVTVLAGRGDALRLVTCAIAVSRVVPVALGAALPYARPSGTGRFLAGVGGRHATVAAALGIAVCLLLHAPLLLVVPAVAFVLCGITLRRWLGGVTGDALGASAELTEVAALVVAVALT